MGDIADMVLDGAFCQSCGGFMGEGCGYPITCEDCEDETFELTQTDKREGNVQ